MKTVIKSLKVFALLTLIAGVGAGLTYAFFATNTTEVVKEAIKYEEKIIKVDPFAEVKDYNEQIKGKQAELQALVAEIEFLESERNQILDDIASSTEAQREEARSLEMEGFTTGVSASVE